MCICSERGLALYESIKHGDNYHRRWLKEAILDFCSGREIPPPKGNSLSEALHKSYYKRPAILGSNVDEKSWNKGYKAALIEVKINLGLSNSYGEERGEA